MALFAFKVRNGDRDRQMDIRRLRRLSKALSDWIEQINGEQSGLRARYQKVADNAAFSLEALEIDCGKVTSGKVTELASSMARSHVRLAFLHNEMVFINNLREIAAQFAKENGLEIRSVSNIGECPENDDSPIA